MTLVLKLTNFFKYMLKLKYRIRLDIEIHVPKVLSKYITFEIG